MKLKKQYFPHDYGARHDPKLVSVLTSFGLAGIGFYWVVVECLYENGGEMTMKDIENVAYMYRFNEDDAAHLVKDFGLFEITDDRVFSQSMKRRIERSKKTSEARRTASNKRWTAERQKDGVSAPEPAKNVTETPTPGTERPKVAQIRYEKIVDSWNRICVSYPKVVKLTDSRKEKIRIRFAQMKPDVCQAYNAEDPYQLFEKIFAMLEQSDFCKGNNTNGWKADFNWITERKDAWENVLNGRYNNKNLTRSRKSEGNINVNELWK